MNQKNIIIIKELKEKLQREIVDDVYFIDLKYNILTDVKIIS